MAANKNDVPVTLGIQRIEPVNLQNHLIQSLILQKILLTMMAESRIAL